MSVSPEPVFFSATYEALFAQLRSRMGGHGESLLRAAGVDPDRLHPAYPLRTFRVSLEALRRAVYPELSEDDAYFRLGSDYVLGMRSTLIGKALYGMATLLGPRRMLERMTRNARTSNNFSDMTLEPRADGGFLMHTSVAPGLEAGIADDAISPHYVRGIIHEVLVQVGARDVRVAVESHDPAAHRTRYRIDWAS